MLDNIIARHRPMHEMSLVQALLEQVEILMREKSADRVSLIRVGVGEFSGVEPDLFRSAFELLVETTPLRGATLHMESVPLESRCARCGREFAIEKFCFQCPACASRDLKILRGEDLILDSVTLEQGEN